MKRWLEMYLPGRILACMETSCAPNTYSYARKVHFDQELIHFDVQQPYEAMPRILLEPIVWSAEVLYPGLGGHMLRILDKVNYRVLDILTPAMVGDMASSDMWFGETTDQAFIEAYKEMNDTDDEEWQGTELTMPSEYWESLGSMYKRVTGAKPFTKAGKARAAKALRHVPWGAALLRHLNQLEKTFPLNGTPFAQLGSGDDGPQIRVEPSYAFWWSEKATLMNDLYDQTFQYRMEASDTYADCLLTADITDIRNHDSLIETIEEALPFIKAVDDFFYFLLEGK